MKNLKSVRIRIASRIIGLGGVFACLAAAVIWLVLVQVDALPFERFTVAGVKLLPLDLMIVIAAAVVFAVVGLILYAVSNHVANSEEETETAEDAEVFTAEADGEDEDDEYIEVSLAPDATPEDDVPEGLEEATAETAEPAEQAEPAKAGKKNKARAVADFLDGKAKAHLTEAQYAKLKKAEDKVKKNAKVILPAAGAIAASALLVSTALEKQHKRNRKKFYQWLG